VGRLNTAHLESESPGSAMNENTKIRPYAARGKEADWYRGWKLSDEERERFRRTSEASREAKARAMAGECDLPKHPIPSPRLNPLDLMPQKQDNSLNALSLFSGCGGLDLGFDRAGFSHVASYDILKETGEVLKVARPDWKVFSGPEGDVTQIDWANYAGNIDVLHGGPPCQPFSQAGNGKGKDDVRDMIPQFVSAVKAIKPRAFVFENVLGLTTKKFAAYLQEKVYDSLKSYHIISFRLTASDFGVPQGRKRVFFVGFRLKTDAKKFSPPLPTYKACDDPTSNLPKTMGVREALGLPGIGTDAYAPTIRSGWTGPRNTTSVVNSAAAVKNWAKIGIWPHGVAKDRESASGFVAKNGNFRLSIQDCMILQGFPDSWPIEPPVYKALGLIGNSVSPPVAYAVACAISKALA